MTQIAIRIAFAALLTTSALSSIAPAPAHAQGVPTIDLQADTSLGVIEGAQTASQTILGGIQDIQSSIKDALGPASGIMDAGSAISDATKQINSLYSSIMDPINQITTAARIITDIPGQAMSMLTGGLLDGGLGGAGLIQSLMNFYTLPQQLQARAQYVMEPLSGGAPSFNWYNGIYGLIMNPATGQPMMLSPGQAYYVSNVVPRSYPNDFSQVPQVTNYATNLFYEPGTSVAPPATAAARRDLRQITVRNDQLNAYATAMSSLGTETTQASLITQIRTAKTSSQNMRSDIMFNTEAVLLASESMLRLEKVLATSIIAQASRAMGGDPQITIPSSSTYQAGSQPTAFNPNGGASYGSAGAPPPIGSSASSASMASGFSPTSATLTQPTDNSVSLPW